MEQVLVIGYGNPGRLDDGLGPAFADAVQDLAIPGVTVDADYQLAVEDAAEAARHDVVVFADASVNGREPFELKRITARPTELSFSTHSLEPDAVLAMAHDLFDSPVRGYTLGIRGYAFNEFAEHMSDRALRNLAAAIQAMEPVLRQRSFEEATRTGGTPENK